MGKRAGQTQEVQSLWPKGYELPVIFITGGFGSGKSMFGYMIDPTPGKVIVFDSEKGSLALAEQFGATHVDMVDRLRDTENGNKPYTYFLEFKKMVQELEPCKYSVAILDTVEQLETSIKAHVDAFPDKYGTSAGLLQKNGGMAWAITKKAWEDLLGDLTSRVQTVVCVSHLRTAYEGGKPTTRKEPRGLETLMKLASLALWLYRDPSARIQVDGKTVSLTPNYPKPSALVMKSRLQHVLTDKLDENGDPTIQAVLPPRIAVATPGAIRKYITTPVDMSALSDSEKAAQFMPDVSESQEAIREREAERLRLERDQQILQAKNTLLRDMMATYPAIYTSGTAVAQALQSQELTYSIENDAEIRLALQQYAEAHHG